MKHPIAVVSIVAAVVLGLSGCADNEAVETNSPSSSSASPAIESTEGKTPTAGAAASSIIPCNDPSCAPNGGLFSVDDKYEFTSVYGTTGAFTFDSKPDPRIETLRKAVGVKPLKYMKVKVDNRQGSESANMYSVTGYDPDGKKYEYLGVSDTIIDWGPTLTIDDTYELPDGTELDETTGQELSSLGTDLYNEYLDSIDVSEVGTITLIHQGGLPDDGFTRVEVNASGAFDPVNAYLEGQAPPENNLQDSYESVDECIEELAKMNAEIDGTTAESYLDDPILKESCEGIVNGEWDD